jgi:hypothetical protein
LTRSKTLKIKAYPGKLFRISNCREKGCVETPSVHLPQQMSATKDTKNEGLSRYVIQNQQALLKSSRKTVEHRAKEPSDSPKLCPGSRAPASYPLSPDTFAYRLSAEWQADLREFLQLSATRLLNCELRR